MQLTEMGLSLSEPVSAFGQWVQEHLAEIDAARDQFDQRVISQKKRRSKNAIRYRRIFGSAQNGHRNYQTCSNINDQAGSACGCPRRANIAKRRVVIGPFCALLTMLTRALPPSRFRLAMLRPPAAAVSA
jgi:hypothetical protein